MFCSLPPSLSSGGFNILERSFTSFVKFTHRYLSFFEVIVNEIVSIYSFSVSLLLIYRKEANDFCKLILYPVTLLKLLMVSRNFWVEFF
jgi:hypothetical protein